MVDSQDFRDSNETTCRKCEDTSQGESIRRGSMLRGYSQQKHYARKKRAIGLTSAFEYIYLILFFKGVFLEKNSIYSEMGGVHIYYGQGVRLMSTE